MIHKNSMDNISSITEKILGSEIASEPESTKKSQTLTEACSAMKEKIQDEAQQIMASHGDNVSKPQTLTEVCSTMKEEIQDEAQRLFPDPGTIHQRTIDSPPESVSK
jgi:hypothetical protein